MRARIVLGVLLAACGAEMPDHAHAPGPRVLDHYGDCLSGDRYLVADARGWYVVELLEGTEADAIAAIEHVAPMTEAAALELFARLNEGGSG